MQPAAWAPVWHVGCGVVGCEAYLPQIFVFESRPPAFEDAAVAKALLALGWQCFVLTLILWLNHM